MSLRTSQKGLSADLRNRLGDDVRYNQICVVCEEGCNTLCQLKYSGMRGSEALYPTPFGKVTAGANAGFPVDWDDFLIQGTCQGLMELSQTAI